MLHNCIKIMSNGNRYLYNSFKFRQGVCHKIIRSISIVYNFNTNHFETAVVKMRMSISTVIDIVWAAVENQKANVMLISNIQTLAVRLRHRGLNHQPLDHWS